MFVIFRILAMVRRVWRDDDECGMSQPSMTWDVVCQEKMASIVIANNLLHLVKIER